MAKNIESNDTYTAKMVVEVQKNGRGFARQTTEYFEMDRANMRFFEGHYIDFQKVLFDDAE